MLHRAPEACVFGLLFRLLLLFPLERKLESQQNGSKPFRIAAVGVKGFLLGRTCKH